MSQQTATTVLLPIVLAVIGAVVGLSGGLLPVWLGTKREQDQWLRDKRAAACETFFKLLQRARSSAYELMTASDLVSAVNPPPSMDALSEGLTDAATTLGMYASNETDNKVKYAAFSFDAIRHQNTRRMIAEMHKEFDTAAAVAELAIRHELGVKD